MIYLTVGSAIGGAEFDRLIQTVDGLAPLFEEKFVAQLGSSSYVPKNMEWFDYVSFEKSLEYFQQAALVIGHCGSGTIINALSFGKPLIVIPRLVQFNENTDDHQLEMAKQLEKSHLAKVVYEMNDLEAEIRKALEELQKTGKTVSSSKGQLIDGIRDFLDKIGNEVGGERS
jgi:beta-1,4-N-acetylglucosaminyltransferase